MRLDTHVVLVSDQPTPNVAPALDGEYRPSRMILTVSPDKAQQAEWLTQALQDTGIRVETWRIDDAWDIEHIRNRMLDLLAGRPADEILALNVTGGTKPMAIAAYEVFRANDRPIFYVHPETDYLIWLYHPDKPPSRDLADRIKLPRFLLAHGAKLTSQGSVLGVPEARRKLAEELIGALDGYGGALGVLNWAAHTAEGRLRSDPLDARAAGDRVLQALLDLFERAGALERQGDRLVFPDEASRFYANGGWLEDYVYALCLDLKKPAGIQDIARGMEVERAARGGTVPNEIDVAFLANNRLHVVECKTRRFDRTADGEGKGADALYKLDTLADLLGGLKAKAMLVSYRPLGAHDLQRAADLRIQVCCGADLKCLPARLRKWIVPPAARIS